MNDAPKFPRLSVCALLLLLFGSGCSAARSSLQLDGQGHGEVYEISADEARSLIFTAMHREFGGAIEELPVGTAIGYRAKVTFMLDSHTISLKATPIQGLDSNGILRDGFIFESSDAGTTHNTGRACCASVPQRHS